MCCRGLQGSYALGLICTQHDDRVYASRSGSPLAVGRGDGASWLASDEAALERVAHETAPLEDGQIAELGPGHVRIFDSVLEEIAPRWTRIESLASLRESGAREIDVHVTHIEIAQQPAILGHTLSELEHDMKSGELEGWCGPLWYADRILAIGCGTSYHAAHAARAWLEQIAGIPVELELGSELGTREPILTEGTMALLVSQSGENADMLEALRHLKAQDVPTVSLVNVTLECDGSAVRCSARVQGRSLRRNGIDQWLCSSALCARGDVDCHSTAQARGRRPRWHARFHSCCSGCDEERSRARRRLCRSGPPDCRGGSRNLFGSRHQAIRSRLRARSR